MATTGWGWGNTANDDEQEDGLTTSLVYGSGTPGKGGESAPAPESLPGPQPSQGNFSTGEDASGSGMSRASATNRQPTPPTYNPSPLPTVPDRQLGREQDLDQQIAKFGTPTNRNDAAVKPRWYERLAGGLAGGMIGVRNPDEGIQAGSSIVNRRYNQAEQARQGNLGNAERQMGDFRAQRQDANQSFEQQMQLHNAGTQDYNSQERAYQGQVTANDRAAQEQQRLQGIAPGTEAPDDPNNKMGGWHATTVGGKPVKMNQPPDTWLNSSEGKIAQETARRQGLVRDNKLTGEEAKYVMVNGKLKEAAPSIHIHNPSADEQEWGSYKKSLGHEPSTAEVLAFKHNGATPRGQMSQGDSDRIIKDRNTGFQKAQADYKKALSTAASPDDRQEAENDFLDAAETVQRGFEDRIKSKTGNDIEPFDIRSALQQSLKGGGKAPQGQQAAPQAPPQQQQPASAPAQGQPGQTVRIQSSNGKLYDIPAQNLQAALKRGAKQVQ